MAAMPGLTPENESSQPAVRKRVAVISMHTGVLDRRIVGQVNALIESGRDVTIVTTPVSLEGTGIDPRVRVRCPLAPRPGTGLRARLLTLYKKLPLPIRLLRRDVWHLTRPGALPPGTDTLVQLADGLDVDAIHVHDLEALPAAVKIRENMTARGHSPCLIYDSHELFPESEPGFAFRRYWSKLEHRYIHSADRVITVNDAIASELAVRYNIPMPTVLMNSVPTLTSQVRIDFAEFARLFQATPQSLRSKRLVIYQGSLRPRLNVENLIRAMTHTDEDIVLLLIGQGVLDRQIERLIAAHAPGRVLRARWVDPSALLAYTRHAHLGVIPYLGTCLNNALATPGKLFEYLEAGIPICANSLSEVDRILKAGRFGACYEFSSPRQIASAIADALARAKAGEFDGVNDNAVRAPYRWQAHAQTLLKAYESLGC